MMQGSCRSLLIVLSLVIGPFAFADSHETTIILVRHAEKSSFPIENPYLTQAGLDRASLLAELKVTENTAAVFATQYRRTQQTVKSLAEDQGLTIQIVDAGKPDDLVASVQQNFTGKTVVIAGHSNTVPEIIHHFGGPAIPEISEEVFDRLFIIKLKDELVEFEEFRYGTDTQFAAL